MRIASRSIVNFLLLLKEDQLLIVMNCYY